MFPLNQLIPARQTESRYYGVEEKKKTLESLIRSSESYVKRNIIVIILV